MMSKQPTTAPLTLSKVTRSNSITSLFIEEISTPQLNKKNNNMVSLPSPCGFRVKWTPAREDNLSCNTSNNTNLSADSRTREYWFKWICWIIVVSLFISFVALMFTVGMNPSSHASFVISQPRSERNSEFLHTQDNQLYNNNVMDLKNRTIEFLIDERKAQSQNKSLPTKIDLIDKIECSCNSNSFYCDSHNVNTQDECVSYTSVCNGVKDCKNGKDEIECIKLSINLKKLEPGIKTTTDLIEGYVIVRVKGIWHPYCSNEWSKSLGNQICNHLGYTKLNNFQLFSLNELNLNQTFSMKLNDTISLMVALKEHTDSNSFHTIDLNLSKDEPWSSCKVSYIQCTIS